MCPRSKFGLGFCLATGVLLMLAGCGHARNAALEAQLQWVEHADAAADAAKALSLGDHRLLAIGVNPMVLPGISAIKQQSYEVLYGSRTIPGTAGGTVNTSNAAFVEKATDYAERYNGTILDRLHDLTGTWTLQIENMRHDVTNTMSIAFSPDKAPSCMAGDWKRLVVASRKSTDDKFFPASEPLSYSIVGDRLLIGRNEVCKTYLQLGGTWKDGAMQGDYVAFGASGLRRLGYFALTQGR